VAGVRGVEDEEAVAALRASRYLPAMSQTRVFSHHHHHGLHAEAAVHEARF
jgi:hypothetical protein